eukprot:GHVQ01035776.1.p1 GENE.GHVQ01035776.1~~GHVQ01035776.1.p1  ORF type:complete len:432 (-),score=138.11 GHVQ01035776.1:630-1925(-)
MLTFFINNPNKLPLYMAADVIQVMRTLYQKIRSFQKYRLLTKNMEQRFADATSSELEEADTCIICRDVLYEGSKKLPCNHVFHLECLKSWFVQQQSCPTCRAEIPTDLPLPSREAQPAAAVAAAAAEDRAASATSPSVSPQSVIEAASASSSSTPSSPLSASSVAKASSHAAAASSIAMASSPAASSSLSALSPATASSASPDDSPVAGAGAAAAATAGAVPIETASTEAEAVRRRQVAFEAAMRRAGTIGLSVGDGGGGGGGVGSCESVDDKLNALLSLAHPAGAAVSATGAVPLAGAVSAEGAVSPAVSAGSGALTHSGNTVPPSVSLSASSTRETRQTCMKQRWDGVCEFHNKWLESLLPVVTCDAMAESGDIDSDRPVTIDDIKQAYLACEVSRQRAALWLCQMEAWQRQAILSVEDIRRKLTQPTE